MRRNRRMGLKGGIHAKRKGKALAGICWSMPCLARRGYRLKSASPRFWLTQKTKTRRTFIGIMDFNNYPTSHGV
jgi:hypothetical protein